MVEGIEVLSFRQIAEEKKMTGMAIVAAADYLLDLVPGNTAGRLGNTDGCLSRAV